jgi:hypothetical protein
MSTTGNSAPDVAAGSTLVIEGDLTPAHRVEAGRKLVAKIRLALVTGGRTMLAGAGGVKTYGMDESGRQLVRVTLNPLIARRIYTSGAELTEAEIEAGLEQLRDPDGDSSVKVMARTQTEDAMAVGIDYARLHFEKALTTGDERALHKAWEMARKVNGLRKRLAAMDHDAPTWVCDGCMGRVVRSEIADMADGEHVLCRRCAA